MKLKPTIKGIASIMKINASMGVFCGNDLTIPYLESCNQKHNDSGSSITFTRDSGYHSSGWWKNPDYERCYHLSLSFYGVEKGNVYRLPKSRRLSDSWVDAFFGGDKKLLWIEPPYSEEGKVYDVWHYRLFCDENWNPIKPSGEVYSKLKTPSGWMSFSDLNHYKKNLANSI